MFFDGDDDPTCTRTCAMLLISGDDMNIDEITRILAINPTETARTGECTGWRVSSESEIQSTNVERHIHWLLDKLDDKKHFIADLKRRNCEVDIYCSWQGHATRNDAGPTITPATLRRVADFDLNLIIVFHC